MKPSVLSSPLRWRWNSRPGLGRCVACAGAEPAGNTSILALHGWLDNAASFAQLAPLLADADVVAIDLPGHGYSDHRPPGTRYHFIDYIPAVLDAMNELGWPNCVLIGHSLGAAIASFTAATEPDRVRGLFLIDGLGPSSEKPHSAPGRLQRSVRRFADQSGNCNNRIPGSRHDDRRQVPGSAESAKRVLRL